MPNYRIRPTTGGRIVIIINYKPLDQENLIGPTWHQF